MTTAHVNTRNHRDLILSPNIKCQVDKIYTEPNHGWTDRDGSMTELEIGLLMTTGWLLLVMKPEF